MLKKLLNTPIKFAEHRAVAYFLAKIKNDPKELKNRAEIVGAEIEKITQERYGVKRSLNIQFLLIQIVITFSGHLIDCLMSDMPQKTQEEIKERRRSL